MYVLVCKVFVKAMMLLIHISERAWVIPIYYFPTCSCCEGTHSPPNQIWLPKHEKSVKGKRGGKMQSQQDACLLKIL